jgi:hypothetical protein
MRHAGRAAQTSDPHSGLVALQRSVGNRATGGLLQRALLSWRGTEWRVVHSGPSELVAKPSFAGEFVNQTYDTETERLSSGWSPVKGGRTDAQNCTDFAFDGDPDLALVADLRELLRLAATKGYRETRTPSDATVVLYGSNGNYSHAIKRVEGRWYEVSSLGGELRVYTASDNPPERHTRDVIVAMLKKGTG